ncbi:mRNA-capping enzyme-like protein, partial [Drosera capensis]
WLDCPNFGKEIYYILPSKVPLGERFNDAVPAGKRYSSKQVFRHFNTGKIQVGPGEWPILLKEQGADSLKLGMVVDLTNTDRYYYPNEFTNKNVKHLKIRCQGRDSVPDNASVNTFFFEVRQFFHYQKAAKRYVLVHCTHGHNRTGYMIVHYLMRTMPISVSDAIQKFSEARPPGIYKEDYIDTLYTFYHERKPDWISCPPTPEWKRSIDLNFGVVPDDDGDGVLADPTNEPREKSLVMDNDDLLGDEIPSGQEEDLRRDCYQLLKTCLGGDQRIKAASTFPGSHPVSLNRVNLQLLRQRYYYATWKADGTRYMMLITFDGCYLIDRSFRFRRVQMRFPCRTANEGQYGFHHYTLLDGEMIIDKVDDKEQARRYLIYDLLALNRTPVTELPFYERWKLLEKEVVEPRNLERGIIMEYWNREDAERRLIEQERAEQNINFHYRYDMEEFRVRRKDFWPLSTAPKILKKFIPTLSHQSDGLIFQGWDDPYVAKTHQGLLKWKYPHMNSVDFLFKMENNNGHLYLFEGGREKLLEGNTVVFKDGTDPISCKDKIIECSWDSEENTWVYMRTRFDKSTPNEFNTYKKVLKSIMDNITEEALLNEIEEIVCLPMYADRIRTPSGSHQQHPNAARRR